MYPILFTVPFIDLPVYSYGVMLGLSLVFGWYLVMYLGKKDGLPGDTMVACYILTAVCAMVGARVLYIVTNLGEYQEAGWIDVLNVRKGGLVAYGGFLGGFLGSWIYLKKKKIRLLPWADAVVPALGSGLGITRIGCFLYGCDYGVPIGDNAPGWIKAIGVSFPNWSVRFPEITQKFHDSVGLMTGTFHGSSAFFHHVNEGLVTHLSAGSVPVYPTQLLEVANGWIAFGVALVVRKRTRSRGQAFLAFTIYYGITRALMEIIRGDTQRGGIGILSTSQLVGIATAVAAAVAWYLLSRRARKDPERAMDLGPGAAPAKAASTTSSVKRTRSKRRKK